MHGLMPHHLSRALHHLGDAVHVITGDLLDEPFPERDLHKKASTAPFLVANIKTTAQKTKQPRRV